MFQRIIAIENEVEWLNVKQVLESNDVPVTSVEKKDASFPHLDYSRYTFQLIIPEEYSAQYFRLIAADYPTQVIQDTTDGKKSKAKLKRGLLIVYAIIISLAFIKYYDINRKVTMNKNFEYEWSAFNTQLRSIDKKTQFVNSVYIDANYNLNYEEVVSYSEQRRFAESFDEDENGFYELTIYYDINGDVSGRSRDENQNGIIEFEEYVLENQEMLLLKDEDEDGHFSIVK